MVEQPDVGDVLVARQHQVDAGVDEQRQHVARVPHRVPLPAGAGDGDEVVVEHEHVEVGRLRELLADPVVALAAHLALGQVGLGGIDGDHLDHGVAVAPRQDQP